MREFITYFLALSGLVAAMGAICIPPALWLMRREQRRGR